MGLVTVTKVKYKKGYHKYPVSGIGAIIGQYGYYYGQQYDMQKRLKYAAFAVFDFIY